MLNSKSNTTGHSTAMLSASAPTCHPSRHGLPIRRHAVSMASLIIAMGSCVLVPQAIAQQAAPGSRAQPPQQQGQAQNPQAAAALQQLLGEKEVFVIRGISVAGNQRIEPETVASYLTLQPGMRAEPELLDLQVKTLFQTGLFSDVSVDMQPDRSLLVTVKENPIVNRVLFEGNKRLKEDKFTEEIQLTARSVYTRAKVQADQQRMIELYRATGRFAANVTPKVVPLAQNRVDVIFEVDEGPKTGIAKVNFTGNEVFTSGELRKVILTSESRWWNFFGGSTSNYDPDRLEYERELLRQHYAKNGYADFQVTSLVAELTPDRKEFFVTFAVEEGPKYEVGEVKVRSALDKLDESTVENFVPIKTGQTFNGERVEKAVESLTFLTGASGYAFVDVNPRLTRYPESKTVDITFEINEGPKVYVERINIKGNTATLDKIIRREMRIAEGDPFNKVQVDRSEAVIRSLGFFSDVTIEEKPGSAPDRTELDVSVQEQSTGTFSIGVGVSSTDNFIADVSVEQRNWLGRGEAVRFRVQASQRTRQVDLRYTKPRFLDRNLTAGGSIFYNRIDNTARIRGQDLGLGGFVQEQIGFGVNTGFQISEYGQAGISYLFTRSDVDFGRDARITPSFQNAAGVAVPASVDGNGMFVNPITGEVIDPLTDDVFRVPDGLTLDDVIFAPFGASLDGTPFTGPNAATDTDIAFGATADPTFIFDDCDENLSIRQFQCESEGTFTTSLLSGTLSFSTVNDPFNPSRGWRARAVVSVAGLGGNVQYARGEFDSAYYKALPVLNDFIAAFKLRGGYITGFAGDTVRIQDRFRQGAQTFRGFDISGVGPRVLVPISPSAIFDAQTLQPASAQQVANVTSILPNGGFNTGNNATFRSQSIGGNAYIVGSAEILLPLPLPDSYGIRASLFTDFGAVGLVDDETRAINDQLGVLFDVSQTITNADGVVSFVDEDFRTLAAPIQDDFSFRLSAGVTIGWNSPFGPIRFDIAEVFIREFYDEVESFRFSAGTNF